MTTQPHMYTDLADWFHLITTPEDYAEEAAEYTAVIDELLPGARTLLELGSGGGNNAYHLKQRFSVTLSDLSPSMLELSGRLNPELPRHQGDMRTIRLNQQFDVVFVHDAVMYLTSETDLLAAMQTAYLHTRPGGLALFVPDCFLETFREGAECEGADAADTPLGVAATPALANRSLRYLEWSHDSDPTDGVYDEEFAYILHEQGQPPRCVYDHHVFGLFPHATWLRLMEQAGFTALSKPFHHSEVPDGQTAIIVGRREEK